MGSSGSSMGIRIPNAILALASPNRNPRIALGETPARLARGPGDGDWRRHHPAPPRRPPSRRAHRESIDCRQRWALPLIDVAVRAGVGCMAAIPLCMSPIRSNLPPIPPSAAPVSLARTPAGASTDDGDCGIRGYARQKPGVGDPYHEFPRCVGAPNGGNTRYGYPLAALVFAEAGAARASRGAVAIIRRTHGGCFNVFVIMRQGTRIMIPLH